MCYAASPLRTQQGLAAFALRAQAGRKLASWAGVNAALFIKFHDSEGVHSIDVASIDSRISGF
jgi:hypothetical protein